MHKAQRQEGHGSTSSANTQPAQRQEGHGLTSLTSDIIYLPNAQFVHSVAAPKFWVDFPISQSVHTVAADNENLFAEHDCCTLSPAFGTK